MADARVPELPELTSAAEDDWYYTVAPSDTTEHATGSGRKIRRANMLAGRLKVISENTTLHISPSGSDSSGDGTSGNPWETITRALAHLKEFWINAGITVTIQLASGNYTIGSSIDVAHPCGRCIMIAGATTYARTMSSVQGSSGSAGAWSVVINLDSVANIAVGDYVLISGASGGSRPRHIMGCHVVTNVDSPNNRITITSVHKYASAPLGAIAATVTVIKTRITATACSGFVVSYGHAIGGLAKMVLVGDGTGLKFAIAAHGENDGTYFYGGGGNVQLGTSLGVVGWNQGIGAYNGGHVVASAPVAIAGCAIGCASLRTGQISIPNAIVSGCDTGMLQGSGASLYAQAATATGCSYGAKSQQGGALSVVNAAFDGNATGIYAASGGHAYAASATFENNGVDTSPAVNTQGNEFAYIDT